VHGVMTPFARTVMLGPPCFPVKCESSPWQLRKRGTGRLLVGFDAGELIGELFQMVTRVNLVRVQREGPLGGFDRLDESLHDEVIVITFETILLDLVVGVA
jgi:hypothetical protein